MNEQGLKLKRTEWMNEPILFCTLFPALSVRSLGTGTESYKFTDGARSCEILPFRGSVRGRAEV